ncbi:hemerythrin domain-containing protein [Massilia sp. P8910]|uniref:hemerythrin domain-containing protein n=1 Tax=Massilia antarctica TaxID=2765360 RepID=UPI0006BDA0A2|nr:MULTISPECIES: hemerythrin domain-containing protein [Massilia]MCE3608450.1 hemerythrin domain-containing protein [Massilia antarctica]MCY0914311.1 hemerythrin domain-containing protein [Massilia sp. H27-R4]CUI08726.1 Regulator of cell morphogenesis and NO signaling [Janthinobacterium sp. CG23_2]CUU32512.1 Regulator of cell morphogenesis and NO signaling [Janthinobacterium sp. CG23_2]
MEIESMQDDAVDILIIEHEEVTALFEQFRGLSARSKESKKRISEDICAALSVHALLEQDIFYPAAKTALKEADLIAEAIVEHASARELIERIRKMEPENELFDATVKVLWDQVTRHAREEEEKMFPRLRKSKLDLVALGARMLEYRRVLETGPGRIPTPAGAAGDPSLA